jgi:hypothetical protein
LTKLTKMTKHFAMSKDGNWFCVNPKDFKNYTVANPYDGGKTEIGVFKLCVDQSHIRIMKGAETMGGKAQDGKCVKGGLGSRTLQTGEGAKRRTISGSDEKPHTGTTASLSPPGGGGLVLPVPAELAVTGRCVAAALELLTEIRFDSLVPWVPIKLVPKIVSKRIPNLKCVKPIKWFQTDTYGNDSMGLTPILDSFGNFCEGSIDLLCDLASINFKAIVQVALGPGNHSMHCVAIFDRLIVDPEDGVRRPLTVKSFEDLKIVKIVTGFRLVPHGRTVFRPKSSALRPLPLV